MITVQLDQCCEGKRISKACSASGRVDAWRFPKPLKAKPTPDEKVLERFLPQGRPFITTDWRMPGQQAERIPDSHAGIVVIRCKKAGQSDDDILAALGAFKIHEPEWDSLVIRNSIIDIWDDHVDICAARGAR